MERQRREGRSRRKEGEQFWRRLVEGQARSGQSVRAWCRQQGVSEPSYYAWRRELALRAASGGNRVSGLVPVELIAGRGGGSVILEIELPGPVKLRVPPGCDLALVRQVLRLWGVGGGESEPC